MERGKEETSDSYVEIKLGENRGRNLTVPIEDQGGGLRNAEPISGSFERLKRGSSQEECSLDG